MFICVFVLGYVGSEDMLCGSSSNGCPTPNAPTNIVPTNIARLNLSGKFPMDMRIPPL